MYACLPREEVDDIAKIELSSNMTVKKPSFNQALLKKSEVYHLQISKAKL
jgi:hypothetical protein